MRYESYDRNAAVAYALGHAASTSEYRSGSDADATAFVSQCIAAGLGRELHCADAQALFRVLCGELGAYVCAAADLEPGDIVQIRTRENLPYKSLIVTGKSADNVLVASHSYASSARPLGSYLTHEIRCLKIAD